MPFPDRPAENADPWYEEREAYDQAIEDEVTAHQTKLAGIATGATANSTDAQLRARSSHTGTQTASTISDFDTEVGNHTDVAANTAARHTHANSAVLAATTASFLTADETKLDGIATGATANATNAELRTRSSHTGTQLASTISDLSATVSAVTDVVNNTAARHTHANKALLDTYTQTEANIADAVTKKHAHANSAVLDATTASFLTADETKLDAIEALADVTDAGNVSAAGALMTTDAPELIRDTMGTALVAGTNVTITPSDVGDTITIAASGGGGGDESAWLVGTWQYPGLRRPLNATAATTALMIQFANWTPIDIMETVNVDALAVNVTTLINPSTIRLGIFTFDGSSTMTLIKDAGTVDSSTTGAKIASFTAYALTAGQYWLGAVPSVTGLAVTATTTPRGFHIIEANLFGATHVTQFSKSLQTAQAAGWSSTTTGILGGTGTTWRIGIRRSA